MYEPTLHLRANRVRLVLALSAAGLLGLSVLVHALLRHLGGLHLTLGAGRADLPRAAALAVGPAPLSLAVSGSPNP